MPRGFSVSPAITGGSSLFKRSTINRYLFSKQTSLGNPRLVFHQAYLVKYLLFLERMVIPSNDGKQDIL
jgi:hypothetical protein